MTTGESNGMFFGPVLPVELITSSRRTRYFVVRVVYGMVLLITLWTQYESTMSWRVASGSPLRPSEQSEFAEEFFQSFAIVQLLAVLVMTPALVAGTIAEEKDRKTIEYLFVTDLRNGEIVVGKLAARLLHLLVLVAVGWPVLALLMLLGGVDMQNVLAMFLITASTALAVAALSIWASVQARRGRDAVMRVFVIGLALLIIPPIVEAFSWSGWPAWAPGFLAEGLGELLAANPFVGLTDAISQSGTNWDAVVTLVRNQAALTIPCVVLAVWRVRRVYLKQTYDTPARPRRTSFRVWRPALGSSPILWKELVAERPVFALGVIGLIAQALLILVVLVPAAWIFIKTVARGPQKPFFDELQLYVIGVGTTVACIGILGVAVRAASSVTAERERQTWDLLISTPIEPQEVIRGKIIGSMYAMRTMVLLLAILWTLGVLGGAVWPWVMPLVLGEVAMFGVFAAAVGLLYSLKMKTSLRAMAATVGTTLFVGGAYLFCCLPTMWSGANDAEFVLAGCIPFLLAAPLAFDPDDFATSGDAGLRVAYLFGLGIYLVVTLVLFNIAQANFDEMTGRVSRSPFPRRPKDATLDGPGHPPRGHRNQ